jgi:hypothetical protein
MAKLQDAVDTYVRARDEHISSLVATLGDTSNKRLSEALGYLDRWLDALKIFNNCLSSSSDTTTAALAFLTTASFEERQAIESLRATNVAEAHDVLIHRGKMVEEKIKALADKWERINDWSREFDTRETEAIESVRRMVDEVILQMAPAIDQVANVGNRLYSKLENEFKLVGGFLADVGTAVGLAEKVSAPAGQMAAKQLQSALTGGVLSAAGMPSLSSGDPSGQLGQVTRSMRTSIDLLQGKRALEYREAIQRRTDGVLVLFNETYRDTTKFIEENGFDKAKARYQETSDTLDRWVSGLPTDGLKSDFGQLRKDLLEKLSRQLSEIETMFNRFVKENEGRFFGPLGPNIAEALTQTKKWEEIRVNFLNQGLDQKLRSFRSSIKGFLIVDIETALKKTDLELEHFDPEVQKQIKAPYEAFRAQVMKEAAELMKTVEEVCDTQHKVFGSDMVAAYFGRKVLEDKLPR